MYFVLDRLGSATPCPFELVTVGGQPPHQGVERYGVSSSDKGAYMRYGRTCRTWCSSRCLRIQRCRPSPETEVGQRKWHLGRISDSTPSLKDNHWELFNGLLVLDRGAGVRSAFGARRLRDPTWILKASLHSPRALPTLGFGLRGFHVVGYEGD